MTRFSRDDTAHKFQKDEFVDLTKTDIYSLQLYLLFILGQLPDYKTLVNILLMTEHDTFLKLCEYFGGETIVMPTLDDLQQALNVIKLYNLIDIQALSYEEAILQVHPTPKEITDYTKLKLLLESYGIKTSSSQGTSNSKNK